MVSAGAMAGCTVVCLRAPSPLLSAAAPAPVTPMRRSRRMMAVRMTAAAEDSKKRLKLKISAVEVEDEPCPVCQAKKAVTCETCSGSGMYREPCLEAKGVLKDVECIDCGGGGTVLCIKCGGRGHL
eukprot:jgi/Chlat1/6807/Chrsp51S06498